MDVSGEHQLDVLHSVFKQRLGLDGLPIEEVAEQYQMGGEGEEGGEEGKEGEGEVMVAGDKDSDKCRRYVVYIPTFDRHTVSVCVCVCVCACARAHVCVCVCVCVCVQLLWC